MSDRSKRLRAKFAKTIREVTVYREQDESYGDDGDPGKGEHGQRVSRC